MIKNTVGSPDVTCPQCGERTRAGQEFCGACKSYLWDRTVPTIPNGAERGTDSSFAGPLSDDPIETPSGTMPSRAIRVASPVRPHAAGGGALCPKCGRVRGGGRRFCGYCGHEFPTGHVNATAHAPRDSDAERRRARINAQAYRRSLPLIYRLRRAAIVVAVAVLVGVVAASSWSDPRQWAADQWYALRGTVVPVKITDVRVTPSSATTAGSQLSYLTDGTKSMWTTHWAADDVARSCRQPAHGPVIILSFAPARVRRIVIYAGAPDDHRDRLQQFRPRTINYRYDDGPCRFANLAASGKQEIIAADSHSAVTTLSVVITDAYDPPAGGRLNTLSITDISLQARP